MLSQSAQVYFCHAAYLYINAVEDVDHVLAGGLAVTVPDEGVRTPAHLIPEPAKGEMREQCATDLLGRLCSDLVQLGEVINLVAIHRINEAREVLVVDGYTVNLMHRVALSSYITFCLRLLTIYIAT